ncbi:hypothetical protein [Pseudomonas sp. UFMG81]|uniref:hypothetical protein n=1 Tax=Pseudomonas sp. UFMG81 TaxID=2745936 RepID=UPI00188E7E0B|nr:hypothetical protein [Pseudomonas sp. UFMG81]
MSQQTPEELLQWLRQKSRLFGWDAIVAIDLDVINRLLAYEYSRRFHKDSYLKPITAAVPAIEGLRQHRLHDVLLDAPRLAFGTADLTDPQASLGMNIIRGSLVSLASEQANGLQYWVPYRVDWIDPRQQARLSLILNLEEVPGTIDRDRRILLDLSKSDDFELDLAPWPGDKREGGMLFKKLFNDLADEERFLELGRVGAAGLDWMKPKLFTLRTQSNPTHDGGALLVFVAMHMRAPGSMPGADSDFRYLLPGTGSSAATITVLADRVRVAAGQLSKGLQNVRFVGMEESIDGSGQLNGWTMYNPSYYVGQHSIIISKWLGVIAMETSLPIDAEDFLMASETVSVSQVGRRLELSWPAYINLRYALKDIVVREFFNEVSYREDYIANGYRHYFDWRSLGASSPMQVVYELSDEYDEEPVLKLERFSLVPGALTEDNDSGLVSKPFEDNSAQAPYLDPHRLSYVQRLVGDASSFLRETWRSLLNDILVGLEKGFTASEFIQPVVEDLVKLNLSLEPEKIRIGIPSDIAYFGKLEGGRSPVLPDAEVRLLAGSKHTFRPVPAVVVTYWSLTLLEPYSGDPGRIDLLGNYTAPSFERIKGTSLRVLVTAHNLYGSSATLVTVLKHSMSLSPQIEVCLPNSQVHIKAGTLGKEEDVQWAIASSQARGQLSESHGVRNTYTAGTPGNTEAFLIERIEASDGASSAHTYIVTKSSGALRLQPIRVHAWHETEGWVRLRIEIGNQDREAEWSILNEGAGTVVAEGLDGLYRSDPNADDRYVLVQAKVEGRGTAYGLIILPLPLRELRETYEALIEVATIPDEKPAD